MAQATKNGHWGGWGRGGNGRAGGGGGRGAQDARRRLPAGLRRRRGLGAQPTDLWGDGEAALRMGHPAALRRRTGGRCRRHRWGRGHSRNRRRRRLRVVVVGARAGGGCGAGRSGGCRDAPPPRLPSPSSTLLPLRFCDWWLVRAMGVSQRLASRWTFDKPSPIVCVPPSGEGAPRGCCRRLGPPRFARPSTCRDWPAAAPEHPLPSTATATAEGGLGLGQPMWKQGRDRPPTEWAPPHFPRPLPHRPVSQCMTAVGSANQAQRPKGEIPRGPPPTVAVGLTRQRTLSGRVREQGTNRTSAPTGRRGGSHAHSRTHTRAIVCSRCPTLA